MGIFSKKTKSGFSVKSTAEQVTEDVDGTDLTAIITGASSGIGAETVRVFALRGVHVVMAVRNLDAGRSTRDTILNRIPLAEIDVMELDLSSMASVRKFASDYISSGLPLNLLINNAAVSEIPYRLSQDNIELHFAINHLGHFLLTELLLETMKRTALESGTEGRIVNLSSEAHKLPYSGGIRFHRINDQLGYETYSAFAASKLSNILHANELTRRLKEEGANITANSLHPGLIVSEESSGRTFFKSNFFFPHLQTFHPFGITALLLFLCQPLILADLPRHNYLFLHNAIIIIKLADARNLISANYTLTVRVRQLHHLFSLKLRLQTAEHKIVKPMRKLAMTLIP